MFAEYTELMDRPSYYVTAVEGLNRYCLLAGPYRDPHAATAVLDLVRRWAIASSGDPRAESYDYIVSHSHSGCSRSILGILAP